MRTRAQRGDDFSRVVEQMGAYLGERFPAHETSQEWDPSRRVVVFRLVKEGRTMLLEVSSTLEQAVAGAPGWGELFDRWGLPNELRRHLRLLVTPSGLRALPWRQLASEGSTLDEELLESFPASDPKSPSSIS